MALFAIHASKDGEWVEAQCTMIKLTETREITPYKWVHPDEER